MNPYLVVARRQRQNRPTNIGWILPVAAAGLAVPLLQPALAGFLGSEANMPQAVESMAFRLGAILAGAMSIHTYTALVRSPDRAVLDAHPVLPRALLDALAVETLRDRAYLPMMGALLFLPIGLSGWWLAWAGLVALGVSTWLGALGVGFLVHLGAVWAGTSPALALVLDLLRGQNPRMQAALIYAPGAVLALMGLVTGIAAAGLRAALEGLPLGWVWLALPLVVGVVGFLLARPLAEVQYVRASAVLAEVDAEWALVEKTDDPHAVYLEWVPPKDAEVLRALRQGWRQIRTWPMGAWFLGAVAAAAGWSGAPDAPTSAVLVAAGAASLVVAVPTRLAEGDPVWLDQALGVRPLYVAFARAWVAWLYAQGAILPSAITLTIRHGVDATFGLVQVEGLAASCALIAALSAWRWRGRGVWAYAPVAVLLWALTFGGSSV